MKVEVFKQTNLNYDDPHSSYLKGNTAFKAFIERDGKDIHIRKIDRNQEHNSMHVYYDEIPKRPKEKKSRFEDLDIESEL